jgi:WD40 repeat protein
LHKRLENYPIPAEFQGLELDDGTRLDKHIRPVFRDRDELAGSAELGPAIATALKQSRFLIVLCSPNAAKSKWVNKEIEDFRSLAGDGKVLALILDGVPNALANPDIDDALECFPPALRYPMEPLAGDLRAEGDGKERGFLKIVSGIADIGFDKLYRRHERLQRKRRSTWAVAASLIIAALAGLSVFALTQKSIAEKQTEFAESETTRANAKAIEAKEQTVVAKQQTARATEQAKIAKEQTKIAQEQTEVAESETERANAKTIEAKEQTVIAKQQTAEAKKQKERAERNARETSRKLAQHYQYRANELLIADDANQKADNAMQATVLLTEAMRVSAPFRDSVVERAKLQSLLMNKSIPSQLFCHGSNQAFNAVHQHIVLTCGQDHTVQLWDSLQDQQIGATLQFIQPLSNAAFSKDGKFAAVFDAKYTWVIDCGSGELVSGPLEIDANYQYDDQHKLFLNRPETSQVAIIDSERIAVMSALAVKVFEFRSGDVVASVEKPANFVFRNLLVLDCQHLWLDLRTDVSGIGILQNKHLVVSLADGKVVREPKQNVRRIIAGKTGMVAEDDVIYLQQLTLDKRLLVFPKKSKDYVEATASPNSNVFLAWQKDGEKTHIYMADVDGRKIAVPPLDQTQIFKLFLLGDQHLLAAYHASRKTSHQRRLEVWNFRTGQLKASTATEDFPDLCRINKKSDKLTFSADKQIFFWDLQKGVHRLIGNHLKQVEHLEFIDQETCLSSDGEIVKKWKFPTPDPPKNNITWARGKFDPYTSKLAFGGDLIAFDSIDDDGNCYFSIYDQKQRRLVVDSNQIPKAKRFHWTPLHFSFNNDLLLIPYWNEEDRKRCFIWDTKSQQSAIPDVAVPIRQVVRVDDSEIVFLGDDDQLHFYSRTTGKLESLQLGPLRDGRVQWSPDHRCIVVEGKEKAFIVDIKTRKIVFDQFSIWPPNETCWLADENAVWCVAKNHTCKINWLTGNVLARIKQQGKTEDLTCLAGRNILISKTSSFDGKIRSETLLKFWDLDGNDLGFDIPFNGNRKFYRSADDRFVHVPGVDSFTTVSTVDRTITVHSDPFLREHLKSAEINIGKNRKYMVVWPQSATYRVYDTATLNPVSKPFSVRQPGFIRTSDSFDNFCMDGEIMAISNRETINFYQTTTGYNISSIFAKDYLAVERNFERNYQVLSGPKAHQLILINETKNEMALIDIPVGDMSYENASLRCKIVSEQAVDSTNAVASVPKEIVIQALAELRELLQTD